MKNIDSKILLIMVFYTYIQNVCPYSVNFRNSSKSQIHVQSFRATLLRALEIVLFFKDTRESPKILNEPFRRRCRAPSNGASPLASPMIDILGRAIPRAGALLSACSH